MKKKTNKYKCLQCGKEFYDNKEREVNDCPDCHGYAIKKSPKGFFQIGR